MENLNAAITATIIQNAKNRLEYEAIKTLILNNIYWLRGHATAVTCTLILRVFRTFMVLEAGFEAAGMP